MNRQRSILIGTRKGAWVIQDDGNRKNWTINGPEQLGSIVYHYVGDPRDPAVRMMAVGSGHLGPTIFLSSDHGNSWREASKPPAFKEQEGGRTVDHTFWLTPGNADRAGRWYGGTSPQGLFFSDDGGDTWQEVSGLNDHPDFFDWRGSDKDGTPDGPKLHSVIVDPRDSKHLLISMSGGGSFESKDEGATWLPLNKGVEINFFPPKEDGSEYEFGHDPHCMVMHPLDSNRLYQQNHCGIYRMDCDKSDRWVRIGDNMPKEVGDIGFPIVVHPRDLDTAWVFPMDGTELWPRTSPDGKPAAYCTHDGGNSWTRQDKGFPQQQAWWTVKRQCMATDNSDKLGIYLGTTGGQVWASFDEGENWQSLAMDLPQIYSVEVFDLN